jgi:putative spermidine/putrescine transport system ATP-binding protein
MVSETNKATAVRLDQCGKTFPDGTRALEPMDIEITGGETIVFLGPSGCGKTTTLRIIAGLESPDRGGEVRFDGKIVTNLPIERRRVGMVFQSYALFPNMNVEQNIAYGLKIRKLSSTEISKRVSEIMDMMHIAELRGRYVNELSGGKRQRVALARAIIIRPQVLLLDEPLTALDALLRKRLRVDIDELLRSLEITAVYVTHDQAEAMMLGDRIVVMNNGRIAQIGTPRQIYLEPASHFVADFIGTMNRVVGVVQDHALEVQGGHIPWHRPETGRVEALFRPEAARVVASDTAALRGTVSNAFFLGDRLRLLVGGIGERPLIIETLDLQELPATGEIGLEVDPDAVMVLRN